jgi:hypothetical protein
VDWTFVAVACALLAAVLAFSRKARLIFVDTVLHPRTPAWIASEGGRLVVRRHPPLPGKKP